MAGIKDFLENVNSLCITGHVRPDGDCVGSVLGLYAYVKKNYPQIDAQVYLEESTEKLSFIAGYDEINSDYPDHAPYDLMICLDAASLERTGKAQKYFKDAKHTINIDHHVSNTMFADENYVNGDSSSASEEIYKLMEPEKVDRDCAIALYTGIIYDTAVFKYRSTSPVTMQIAGELMKHDIPTDQVIDESFYAKTFEENRIFGYAVLKSQLAFDGKVIYSSLSRKEMDEFAVSPRELEGIVAQLRLTKGVLAAAFLSETAAGDVKVSLRSIEPFDVNAVAQEFGGGGHVRAAGATVQGSLDEVTEKILEAIGKNL